MKALWIFLLFSFTALSHAEPLVLEGLYEKWQSFQKSSEMVDFGLTETPKSMKLVFGESFSAKDHINNAHIVSCELDGDVLQVTLGFPQTVLDLSEVEMDEEVDYKLISKLKVLALDPNKGYDVEFYGLHSLKTSGGELVSKKEARLFARMKFLSSPKWLRHLQASLEVEDVSIKEFKAFLDSEIPEFKVGPVNYEELAAGLKKTFKENGYDLIFIAGKQDIENPTKYSLSREKVSVRELVQRVSALQMLKYRFGKKEVFIAPAETFKRSKTIKNKDGLDLPGIKVNVKTKKVILDAKVCLSSGILEYLMCLQHSFEHESIFVTKVKPELIHMGLLLVNARQMPYKGRSEIMKKLSSNQSRLKIEVQWEKDGELTKVDLNKLLIDRSQKDKKAVAEDLWFFAGSYFTKSNIYAANIHQSVISLQQHPASVIHYGKITEDPYRSNRGGFEVNDDLCPPMDTEVKLVFTVQP